MSNRIKLLLVLSLLLGGCNSTPKEEKEDPIDPPHNHTFSNEWSYDETYHWHDSTCGHDVVSDKEEHSFDIHNICTVCGYEAEVEETIFNLDIYASNDFHGQVEKSYNRMGLVNFGTYMKSKGELENTLLLDQGDTWQGSIYSNHNHGALVNDVMCLARFDARTVGNHDFDWGIDILKANCQREYDNYRIPVLAANIYKYDFKNKLETDEFIDDIGQKSIIYTMENGLKVGIVGVIGDYQISSITSYYVQDVYFKNQVEVIKEEAGELRKKGCDVVIASTHCPQDTLLGNDLNQYVDLVLCGHSHRYESTHEGNLYYAQFGRYGERLGHISLTYDKSLKKVTNTSIQAISAYDINDEITNPDQEIAALVNQYNNECSAEANVVLANDSDNFVADQQAANLMCRAMLDGCIASGYTDVILSYTNTARLNLPSGGWTYADIYNGFPFDNVVCIAEIKGRDILWEVKNYNNVCYNDSFNKQIDPNQYYKIATIDYLLYHTNEQRNYDYFSSFNGVANSLNKNYRELLRDWLIDNGYPTSYMRSSDFSSSRDCYNRDLLTEI